MSNNLYEVFNGRPGVLLYLLTLAILGSYKAARAGDWPAAWSAQPQSAARYAARLAPLTWSAWENFDREYLRLQMGARETWFNAGSLQSPFAAAVVLRPGTDFSLKAALAPITAPTPVFDVSAGGAYRLGQWNPWLFSDWHLTQNAGTFLLRQLMGGLGWNGGRGRIRWAYTLAVDWFAWYSQGQQETGFLWLAGGRVTWRWSQRWGIALEGAATTQSIALGLGWDLHLP